MPINGVYHVDNAPKNSMGLLYFNFNDSLKRFNYYSGVEQKIRISSGRFESNKNILIFNSDTNINSLKIEYEGKNVFIEKNKNGFKLNTEGDSLMNALIKYTIIVDDTASYIIKNNDSLLIDCEITKFRIKIDVTNLFNSKTVSLEGKNVTYYADKSSINLIYFSNYYYINNHNNFHHLTLNFSKNLFRYETFENDTVIIKKNKFRFANP